MPRLATRTELIAWLSAEPQCRQFFRHPEDVVSYAGQEIADILRRTTDRQHIEGARVMIAQSAPWLLTRSAPAGEERGDAYEAPPELVATETARARLEAWLAAGRPTARAEDARILGDEVAAPYVQVALAAIDAPALDFVVQRCSIVTVGSRCDGLHLPGGLPSGPVLVIGVDGKRAGGDRIARVTWHEAAHAWLREEADRTHDIAEQQRVEATAEREGWLATKRETYDTHERQAEALADVWEQAFVQQEGR